MLLVVESFKTYSSIGQLLQRSGYLQWTSIGFGDLAAGIDSDGQGVTITTNTGAMAASLATNITAGFIGHRLKMETASGPALYSFTARESNSGQNQFNITLHGDDLSISYPGGRTTNNLFPLNTWFYLEIGWVISKTVGSVRVRINGRTVLNITGINTAPSTTNLWMNGFNIAARDFATSTISDLYLCDDTTGPGTFPNNGFLGDCRVFARKVNGAGDLTQWTSSDSDPNWQQLLTPDDDTNYNSTSTAGQEDLFTVEHVPANVTAVLGVQLTGRYKKVDASAHTLTQRIKSGGVDAPGVGFLAPYGLATTEVVYSDVFALDPGASASWTPATVNASQIGCKLET